MFASCWRKGIYGAGANSSAVHYLRNSLYCKEYRRYVSVRIYVIWVMVLYDNVIGVFCDIVGEGNKKAPCTGLF